MASLTGMEYMDINPNWQMRQGYRLLDRAQLNRVEKITTKFKLFLKILDYANMGWAISTKYP
jgi:hypothetical protein